MFNLHAVVVAREQRVQNEAAIYDVRASSSIDDMEVDDGSDCARRRAGCSAIAKLYLRLCRRVHESDAVAPPQPGAH